MPVPKVTFNLLYGSYALNKYLRKGIYNCPFLVWMALNYTGLNHSFRKYLWIADWWSGTLLKIVIGRWLFDYSVV